MLEMIQSFFTASVQFLVKLLISAFPFINAILIVVAGCLGTLLYKRLQPVWRDIMTRTIGLAVLLLGISELWDSFFVWEDGQVEIAGTMLVVFALLVGGVFGYALDVDRLLGRLGVVLYRLFEGRDTDKNPAGNGHGGKNQKEELPPELLAAEVIRVQQRTEGFTMATVLCGFSSTVITHFLVGRMTDDSIPLLVKLGIDFVIIFALTAIYGSGTPFAAVTVLLSEGVLGLVYTLWGDLLTPEILDQTALVGAVILLVGGIQLATGKKIRPANLLPALLIPGLYTLLVTKIEEAVENAGKDK